MLNFATLSLVLKDPIKISVAACLKVSIKLRGTQTSQRQVNQHFTPGTCCGCDFIKMQMDEM